MNLFKINFNDNHCLVLVNNNEKAVVKKIGSNIFFYEDDLVVGFNIFDFKNISNIKDGRVLINKAIVDEIQNTYNIKLKITHDELCYFTVGNVVECEKVPNTHLSLCKVDIGKEVLQIVCGAKNVRKDLKVVVATIGLVMNNGMLIKKSKLQGIDSFGMLCSQKELGLTRFNPEGIIELDDNYRVGSVFSKSYSYEFK